MFSKSLEGCACEENERERGSSVVMVKGREWIATQVEVEMNEEIMEDVTSFRY